MLWSGIPPVTDGEWMWSIVQSLPSSSLWQVTHRGSSIFLAIALASRHSLESCQSLIVVILDGCGREANASQGHLIDTGFTLASPGE
jgi:hypothetical protein